VTPKQERFCREYLVDLNGTQAAIRAGYSPKTANEQAARLLAKVNVIDRLSGLQAKREQRVEVKADEVLNGLAKIAYCDPRLLYGEDGRLLHPSKLPDSIAFAVASIEHTDKGGVRIRLNDRVKSLELLGKHLALFRERVEVQATSQVVVYIPDNRRGDSTLAIKEDADEQQQ
jgi:phage terminase small subunit